MKKSARLICMLLLTIPFITHAGLVVGKDEQGVQTGCDGVWRQGL
jgi:hypothetical protein